MAYRETMENNGMEAGRAKNQIPYCTVVLVALNVTGALLFLVIVKKGAAAGISLKRAVFAVVLSLYAGFGSAYVNNAAHVGGLLSGFLLGFLLSIIPPVFRKKGFSHEKR